jgi:hypothetical protein
MSPEEAAKSAWFDLSDDEKIAKFNEWAVDAGYPNSIVFVNNDANINGSFSSTLDAIQAAVLGGFDPSDGFFTFDGVNLKSYKDAFDVVQFYIQPDFMDDVIAWMLANKDFGDYEVEVNGDGSEVE